MYYNIACFFLFMLARVNEELTAYCDTEKRIDPMWNESFLYNLNIGQEIKEKIRNLADFFNTFIK